MGKTSSRSDGSTHADRKFEKKMQFYELVRGSVVEKAISKEKRQKKRSRQKKLKAYDLSTLSEYLPELSSPSESPPVEIKINSKTRNKLLLKEANQLKTVINHPVFQLDPLGANVPFFNTCRIHNLPQMRSPREKIKKSKRKRKSRRACSRWRCSCLC